MKTFGAHPERMRDDDLHDDFKWFERDVLEEASYSIDEYRHALRTAAHSCLDPELEIVLESPRHRLLEQQRPGPVIKYGWIIYRGW